MSNYDNVLSEAKRLYRENVKCVPVNSCLYDYRLFMECGKTLVQCIVEEQKIPLKEATDKAIRLITA